MLFFLDIHVQDTSLFTFLFVSYCCGHKRFFSISGNAFIPKRKIQQLNSIKAHYKIKKQVNLPVFFICKPSRDVWIPFVYFFKYPPNN
jgi:hypothetical protein